MRAIGVLVLLLLASVALAGCTSERDIESEAKEREEWARDHNAYRPVAVLSGPQTIAPGALVWFSAHGSHDPDFFGAKRSSERNEAQGEGGFHVRDDASDVSWSWTIHLDEERNDGLGNGVRRYEWSIDGGRVHVAPELTHRYGSMDGPVRFPVGFTEEGTHTLTLTVVDWSGETDTISVAIEVAAGGTASTIPGWIVTERGWETERIVPVTFEQYGDCPPIGRSQYDPSVHHMSVPWDLFFFMGTLQVEAEWDALEAPFAATAPTAAPVPLVGDVTTDVVPTDARAGLNLNDVAVSLGHCETTGAWAAFDADQDVFAEDLVETGEVSGEEAASNVEMTGAKTERRAEWDINVYLSDEDNGQWGKGGDVTFRTIFVPAVETGYGGQ